MRLTEAVGWVIEVLVCHVSSTPCCLNPFTEGRLHLLLVFTFILELMFVLLDLTLKLFLTLKVRGFRCVGFASFPFLRLEHRLFDEKQCPSIEAGTSTCAACTLHPNRQRGRNTELDNLLDVGNVCSLKSGQCFGR
jgi:hypothetical protein